MLEFKEALLDVLDYDLNYKIGCEAKSLATHDLGDFIVLIAIII